MITGGSGFIGTNLVEHFRQAGHTVTSLDLRPPRHPEHASLWRQVDLLDHALLNRVVSEAAPEFVFHMAARTDLQGMTRQDYPANTTGVANLVDALQSIPQLRLAVFASSMLVCRIGYRPLHESDYCPSTAYGESKVEGEGIVRSDAANRFPWVIVRPTSIWGPWFGPPYRDFFTAVRRGLYVHPDARTIRRSYGFVLNAVSQLACLADSGGGPLLHRTCYLADHDPVDLKTWADTISMAFNGRSTRSVPVWALKAAARGGDLLQRLGMASPPMTSFRLNNLLTDMVHDTEPLRRLCGDSPYTMEQGVRITVEWLRQQPD